jgi:hypothetical protein
MSKDIAKFFKNNSKEGNKFLLLCLRDALSKVT